MFKILFIQKAKESLDEPAPVIPLKEPSKPNDDLDNEKETLVVEYSQINAPPSSEIERDSKNVNANSTEADEPMKEKMVEKDMPLGIKGSTNVADQVAVSSDDDLACKISEFIIKAQKSKISSGKKRKGMTPNKQKAEIGKPNKGTGTSHQLPKKKKVHDELNYNVYHIYICTLQYLMHVYNSN